ncbi:MAG: AMP-binding protein, partial [bacterium]|nr:AMP-binding protein [bacterium]
MKPLDKKNIENVIALTPVQEGMLFHYLKEPESHLYFEQLSLEISGEINRKTFEKTWNTVIATNEMLRTLFRWEKVDHPVQVVLKEHRIEPHYYDLTGSTPGEGGQTIQESREQIKKKDRAHPFQLKEVPFRVTLIKLAKNKDQMIISNHHILYDGWSNGIILKEFFQTYNAYTAGQKIVKPVKTKFKEYVKWLREQDKNSQIQYWKESLQGIEASSGISIKKRNLKEQMQSTDINLNWGSKLKTRLDEFSREHKITPAAVLYTAWGLLLQRYNNSEEVLLGTTVSGRTPKLKGIENIVGLFINTLPLRVASRPEEKTTEILQRVYENSKTMEEYENTSLVTIKESSPLGIEDSLFDTIVVIENYPLDSKLKNTGGTLSLENYIMFEMTNYDITVGISVFDELGINLMYNREIFEEESIIRLAAHFNRILQGIVENPGKKYQELDILPEEEKKRILQEFNETKAPYPKDKTLHRIFEEQVNKTPENIAIVGKEKIKDNKTIKNKKETIEGKESAIREKTSSIQHPASSIQPIASTPSTKSTQSTKSTRLTYRELSKKSNQLAAHLIQKGVKPGAIIAIKASRSIEMVTAILAIIKAGAAYLPIMPEYPQERVEFMLKDSNAALLLVDDQTGTEPKERNRENKPMVLNLKHLTFEFVSDFEIRASDLVPSSLAYVIYTSGSTGTPKGVMVEHSMVVNILTALQNQYPMAATDTYLFKTSYVFDVSVTEIFGWYFGGARLAVLEREGEKDPAKILDGIEAAGVTHINFVPAMFSAFIENISSENVTRLAPLKYIFLAGEALPGELVARFRRLNKTITLENIYGPTEATIYAASY